MRRAIPAFNEFSELAVELKDIFFISGAEYSKWKIISPITYEDNKKIKEYSKESFVDYIINKNVFVNLVQYVKKHGKYKEQEESIIIDEYKRLIEEYYKVIKEE